MNTTYKIERNPWRWLTDLFLLIMAFLRLMRLSLINIGENIYKIAITGGPCSGKTDSMKALRLALEELGYIVLNVPESATILINRGIRPENIGWVEFQAKVLDLSFRNERRATMKAILLRNLGYKVVILCDRGLLDGEAYVDSVGRWADLLRRRGLDNHILGNHSHHLVIHLVTTADGAEDVFDRQHGNNDARRESTKPHAIEVDGKTERANRFHHHRRRIPNRAGGMEQKISEIIAEVRAVIGDPDPIECEHKFVIKPVSFCDIPAEACPHTVHITQTYLLPPKNGRKGETHRLRIERDLEGSGVTYWFTRKWDVENPGERGESNRVITRRMYYKLLRRSDRAYDTIYKHRIRFMHQCQLFEVDEYIAPQRLRGLWVMEAEVHSLETPLSLPPYVEIESDATHDKSKSNKSLAKRTV